MMNEYIIVLVLQALVGLLVAKHAIDHKKSFWRWWCYGTFFPVIAFVHLSLILSDEDQDDANNSEIGTRSVAQPIPEKHAKNCSCNQCILEGKRYASHIDWYNPEQEDTTGPRNKR